MTLLHNFKSAPVFFYIQNLFLLPVLIGSLLILRLISQFVLSFSFVSWCTAFWILIHIVVIFLKQYKIVRTCMYSFNFHIHYSVGRINFFLFFFYPITTVQIVSNMRTDYPNVRNGHYIFKMVRWTPIPIWLTVPTPKITPTLLTHNLMKLTQNDPQSDLQYEVQAWVYQQDLI